MDPNSSKTEQQSVASAGDVLEPSWPTEAGPYLFLLDVSSKFEYELLKDWIERNRPPGVEDVTAARIPASRRLNQRRLDPRLGARLAEADDPLLVPLRVVWLASKQDGMRRIRLRDVLVWGDPRDPGRWSQRWIARTNPDRCRIVMGEPARKKELDDKWRDPGGHGPSDGTPLEEYVALQAWLSLERAERGLRGLRYKVPKFLREDLYWRRGFQRGVAELALGSDTSLKRMQARTARYLREMAATHSPYVIDVVIAITGAIIGTAHRELNYDAAELRMLYGLSQKDALIFLPSHKSNFDHLALSYALYQNELPQNHTAGGINLNFFPIGPLLRRTGVFFIRREFKDNGPYKFVLREYLEYLLEKRFTLEWYIEGGRSRTGKLREPKLGLLAYVTETYVEGIVDDIVLAPVSITYDQIIDVRSYAQEQAGGSKERESFGWALRFIASARRQHGGIYLRFGAPIRMSERIAQGTDLSEGDGRLAVPKLAFEVSIEINAVTPITPVSLVSLALLSSRRSKTVGDTVAFLEPYLDDIVRRALPTSFDLAEGEAVFAAALHELSENDIIDRIDGPTASVYTVDDGQALAVAYYRNVVIHHFLIHAIAEVAEASPSLDGPTSDECALAIRDLLKFDFFFSERRVYLVEIGDAMIQLAGSSHDPPFSPAVLRPFLDSYLVVAEELTALDTKPIDRDSLVDLAMQRGTQYAKRGDVARESVSKALYGSATKLASHRGLLDGSPEERSAFAWEVRGLIDLIHELDRNGPWSREGLTTLRS